jgi:hypothetical protein
MIPLLAAPIGIIFWIIDVRTRDLYHAATDAGEEIEGEKGGFFTVLKRDAAIPEGVATWRHLRQSLALNLFFLGSSVVLLGFSISLYVRYHGTDVSGSAIAARQPPHNPLIRAVLRLNRPFPLLGRGLGSPFGRFYPVKDTHFRQQKSPRSRASFWRINGSAPSRSAAYLYCINGYDFVACPSASCKASIVWSVVSLLVWLWTMTVALYLVR